MGGAGFPAVRADRGRWRRSRDARCRRKSRTARHGHRLPGEAPHAAGGRSEQPSANRFAGGRLSGRAQEHRPRRRASTIRPSGTGWERLRGWLLSTGAAARGGSCWRYVDQFDKRCRAGGGRSFSPDERAAELFAGCAATGPHALTSALASDSQASELECDRCLGWAEELDRQLAARVSVLAGAAGDGAGLGSSEAAVREGVQRLRLDVAAGK
jgi:hypothetical protein